MALDKWIAIIFLIFSLIYGYASINYPLLPFERNMAFLPNTLPTMLSGLGIIIAFILIFAPKSEEEKQEEASVSRMEILKEYKIGQAVALLSAMVIYALLLRPMGFIPSTIFFLVGSGWILGERKLHLMIGIASIGTVGIWYLVQEVLGIFLRPLPWFVG